MASHTLSNEEKILFNAIRRGNLYRVIASVEGGVSVNCQISFGGDYPIQLACSAQTNTIPICKYLLKKGADVNAIGFGHPALVLASFLGNLRLVKYLISQGADINFIDSNGETALHQAGWGGCSHIYNFLASWS